MRKLKERCKLIPTEVANLRGWIREAIKDELEQIDELVLKLLTSSIKPS